MVKMIICPICEKGNLVKKQIDETMFGVPLGKFPAEVLIVVVGSLGEVESFSFASRTSAS